MSYHSDSYEREVVNNQKRIIRELKRIADALEHVAKNTKDLEVTVETVTEDEITVENEIEEV